MCNSVSREVELRNLRRLLTPIAPLFEDASICAILINGPYRVYAETAGRMQLTGCRFDGLAALRAALEAIARCEGRELGPSEPFLAARLPDGSRLDAVMSQIAAEGPLVAIRRPRERAFDLAQIVTPADHSRLCAALASRSNILVTGTRGSGKTALLNALAAELPEAERIVVLERMGELRLSQPHVVRLREVDASIGSGRALPGKTLVELARRLRPDWIVLDDLGGREALALLQALTEGQDGSVFALGARCPARALARLEQLALAVAPQLPIHKLRSQITSAVDLVVHTSRLQDGSCRITEMGEPRPAVPGAPGHPDYVLRAIAASGRALA